MNFSVVKNNNAAVVSVTDRLDGTSAPIYEEKAAQEIPEDVEFIVVDLAKLEYISSAGLRAILRVAKKNKSENKETILCGAHDMVENLLKMTGFNSMFKIYKTQNEALQAVAGV